MPKEGSVVMEGVTLVFLNFSGKEGQYNREGDRNFAVLLDETTAQNMAEDGWNVKWLKPREGDDPEEAAQAFLEVSVNYKKGRPPQVTIITDKRRNLHEDEVDQVDWLDITNADLIINPYRWEVNGKTGIKAYLHSLYLTIDEDPLAKKYSDLETGR